MNFTYTPIDPIWCYISYTEVHVWRTEHISYSSVLDHELSIHTHCLTLMLLQTYISPCLTYWTYFCQINPRSWNVYIYSLTPSDDTSAVEYCIFYLKVIFLDKEYSVLNFSYITIDSIWCCLTLMLFWCWNKVRRSQWASIESSRSSALGPEICSLGQIWTTVCLM